MFLRHICLVIGLLFATATFAAPVDYVAEMAMDADGAADPKTKTFSATVSQKGRVLRKLYVSPKERSSLEVFGNYLVALKAKGFTVVFECENATCGKNFKDLKYTGNDTAKNVISDNAWTC
jgi:OmpA-OmpF porin, OOP family